MIHIRNPSDLHLLHDPELLREVQAQLSYCISEFLEYEDAADLADHDFSFSIVSDEDIDYVNALGPPEELARIEIHSETVRTIYRVIYTTEVLFIPGELADRITIL